MSRWEQFEHGHREHRFERGDLRYIILDLLEDHPSHGYEIIHALGDRFHGFYSPSPGTVYPTLQWLEDLGYVTVVESDGRKTYTVTDEGRRFLVAHESTVDEVFERVRRWWSPFDKKEFRDDLHDLMGDLRDIGRDLRHEMRWADPAKLPRVRDIVMRASHEIEDILRETPGEPSAVRPRAPGPAPMPEAPASPPSDAPRAKESDAAQSTGSGEEGSNTR